MKTILYNGQKRQVSALLMKPNLVRMSRLHLKTNTRRLSGLEDINDNPNKYKLAKFNEQYGKNTWVFFGESPIAILGAAISPYGKKGDIIWVREMWTPMVSDFHINPQEFVNFAADYSDEFVNKNKIFRPSIHMPAIVCRHFLEIVDIRPERLQSITNDDAIAEGIEPLAMSSMQIASYGQLYRNYNEKAQILNEGVKPVSSFRTLWVSINGQDSWNLNPWVWRIEYKEIPKPEGWDALFPFKPKSK